MPFDNRHVLETYSHSDIKVLKQVCHLFRREFMNTANVDVFVKSIMKAFACNTLLR